MGAAFRAADLVVARAGASMLGECPAFGLPSVLVPLTFAWRYQKVNADYLTERGAAVQLTDETLPEALLPTVRALLFAPDRLAGMAAAAAALDRPDEMCIRDSTWPSPKPLPATSSCCRPAARASIVMPTLPSAASTFVCW